MEPVIFLMGHSELTRRVRTKRILSRAKKPFESTVFDRVNGLVRAYSMGEAFLEELARAGSGPPQGKERFDQEKPKASFEPPLFSLSGEEEYRVTMAILRAADNPYLAFVTAPEEILVCRALFSLNPHLGAETLAAHHFETLLRAEAAKTGQV